MTPREIFFKTLNDFFDHIYVITLQRATDRHRRLEVELNGLDYGLFFGKDRQEFSIEHLKQQHIYDEDLAKKVHRYSKPLSGGQIGCAWSHAEVYKDVIQKGYSKVLILEDDIVVDMQNIPLLPHVLQQLPPDWEVLYFGFAKNESKPKIGPVKKLFYHLLRLLGAMKYSHATIKNLYPKKCSEHIYKAGYHDCTHAYAITPTAAEKLLRLQQPIAFIADNLLAHAVTNHFVNGYIMLPKLINQEYQVGKSSASYVND